MKVYVLYVLLSCLLAAAVAHHIPGHVGSTDPVLLVVPGVPVTVHGDGEGYVLHDWDGVPGHGVPGVVVPGTKVRGSFIVAPELPGAKLISGSLILPHLRRRRGTSFSYISPDGTSRSEQVETYVDPRVKDRHPLTRVTGRVSWKSPEGVPVTINYVADGAGYRVLPS